MASIELAILYPVILFVVLGMFQVSLYWHTANIVAAAADEGLEAGRLTAGGSASVVEATEAAEAFLGLTVSETTASGAAVSAEVSADGERLQVTVAADAPRVVGLMQWRVEAVAEGRFEAFIPADQR